MRPRRSRTYCRAHQRRKDVPRNTILLGDAATRLAELPAASVDTVATSPPYYALRDYQVAGQLGLEARVDDYVRDLMRVFDQVARVLKPTGSLWLNLGDSYSRHNDSGAPPKSLLLAPERVALALVERGWVLRSKVVWSKPNAMPHSVGDRLSTTWEYVFHLVRAQHYFYDLGAIREPHTTTRKMSLTHEARGAKANAGPTKYESSRRSWAGPLAGSNAGLDRARAEGRAGHPDGKNPGDVWRIATAGYKGAHHAVYPTKLIERPLRATCPARTCTACGAPWQQQRLVALRPSCGCTASWWHGLVLDPFMGAGTTAVAATELGRDWLGVELSPTFRELALSRIAALPPMSDVDTAATR